MSAAEQELPIIIEDMPYFRLKIKPDNEQIQKFIQRSS